MEPINVDLESEGLEILVIGLNFPGFINNKLLRAIYGAVALEAAAREGIEMFSKDVPLPNPDDLSDVELAESIGFFDAFCAAMMKEKNNEQYPKTFSFCVEILGTVMEEMNKRKPDGMTTLQ